METEYALLLFPHSPEPATDDIFEIYFRPTLDHVFKVLCNSPRTTTLEIALPLHTLSHSEKERQLQFVRNAKLIDGVVRQADASLATISTDTCRYRLIFYSRHEAENMPHPALSIALRSLVHKGRPWVRIFTIESPSGEELRDEFKALGEYLAHSPDVFERVPGGIHVIAASQREGYYNSLKLWGHSTSSPNVAAFFSNETPSRIHSLLYLMAYALDAGEPPYSLLPSPPPNLIVGNEANANASTAFSLDKIRSVLESPRTGQHDARDEKQLGDLEPGQQAISLALDPGARCLLQHRPSASFRHFVDSLPKPCVVLVPEEKVDDATYVEAKELFCVRVE